MTLDNLEPKYLWQQFDRIRQVPRPSKHEEKIREYPEQWFAFRPTWGVAYKDRLRSRKRRSLLWRRRSDELAREAVNESHRLRERDGKQRSGRDS